jgi:protease-4
MPRRLVLTLLVVVSFILPSRVNRTHAQEPAEKATKPTIAVFALTGEITESPIDEPFPLFDLPVTSLRDLTRRLTRAATDDNVKAVVLLAENAHPGAAQIEELRQSMAAIQKAGKEVYVHSDSLGMADYVLFSGATRIAVSPTADLWVTGLYGEQPYLRGLLDKLGVQPDFLTCGDYKSAAEIFMRTEPSKQADEMHNWLLDSIHQNRIALIAKGRNVAPDQVEKWIDNGPYTAEKAKAAGLIDAVEHRQDFTAFLKKKYGEDLVFDRKYGQPKQPTIDFSNPFVAFKILGDLFGGNKKPASDKPAVGIVFVEGPIMLGNPEPSIFGAAGEARSSAIRKALDQAAADDKVKAVVLRVNSPGGSAVASEIILDATRRVKAKKPFVVSMGDVAGSGGYYVACASDTIFADPSTITASIGVVAGKVVTTPMWNKIGVTFKPYARGARADLLNSDRPFTDDQRAVLQSWMDDIYGVFKQHVTDARKDRLKNPLDQLAGGRVYTGRQALDLGLVDQLGTLNDAIAFVAAKADMKDGEYDTRPVPEPKNFIEQLMEQQSGGSEKDKRNLIASTPSILQMALPLLSNLDPHRVAIIKQSLRRLDMIQSDGAVLMMPEIATPR